MTKTWLYIQFSSKFTLNIHLGLTFPTISQSANPQIHSQFESTKAYKKLTNCTVHNIRGLKTKNQLVGIQEIIIYINND